MNDHTTQIQAKNNHFMRKLIVFNWLSLDGFIAGPNGETDWFVWDEEIEEYAKKVQNSIDTMLFGRVTYNIMANYWPTKAASAENPGIIEFMNNTPKIVFSKSLKKANWNQTRLMKDIVPEEIIKMKQEPGKDMIIYGSSSIISQLTSLILIDEYSVMVNPIVLGTGKPLFQNMDHLLKLKLLSTKTFRCGNVLLNYQPDK